MVRKITAQTDGFSFSNSMSESTHSIYKTEFLKKKVSTNQIEYLKSLNRFVTYYNHERFPTDLFGYTAVEVLDGEIPDKNRFKEQIANARKKRVLNPLFLETYEYSCSFVVGLRGVCQAHSAVTLHKTKKGLLF